jgi:signal peptidase II
MRPSATPRRSNLRFADLARIDSSRQPSARVSPPAAYAFLLALALLVLLADQAVKALVSDKLKNGRVVEVLGGFVRLDYTFNTGAAFGIFRTGGVVFAAVAVGVSAGIVIYYRRVATSPLILRAALGLILGGALGNLLDRIRLGYVVDFIDLRWWPVFNLADSAIVVGVCLLVLHALFEPHIAEAK